VLEPTTMGCSRIHKLQEALSAGTIALGNSKPQFPRGGAAKALEPAARPP
jgi:hypothetical protein